MTTPHVRLNRIAARAGQNFTMKKLIIPLLALALLPLALLADAGDRALPTDLSGIPVQYQVYLTWAVLAFKYLSELYSSVRNGGGLRRIALSFWFGENLPAPVATDYKVELNTQPTPPTP